MQKLFSDTRILDKLSREKYALSEEIMMENATVGLSVALESGSVVAGRSTVAGSPVTSELPARVVILCGSGNNGADGYALARRIAGRSEIFVVAVAEPKSELCKIQAERAKKVGVEIINIKNFKDTLRNFLADSSDGRIPFVVDCIFGSGYRGDLDGEVSSLLETINSSRVIKIACDVPTGVRGDGTVADGAFSADVTVTMGALKTCLYSDEAKDFVGEVFVEDLGISRELFENCGDGTTGGAIPEAFLLEESDFTPPLRKKNNVNKGSFGYVAVFSGEKSGASVIAGLSALNFGAGLVTLISEKSFDAFPELMASEKIPEKTNVVVAGPGFGRENPNWEKIFEYLRSKKNVAAVLDADVFYREEVEEVISRALSKLRDGSTGSPTLVETAMTRKDAEALEASSSIILTPHPKEFQNLWKMCFGEELTVEEIVKNKINLAKKFAEKYPCVVLVLKGANVVIATSSGVAEPVKAYICPFGTAALAKAGSGDVLSGLIAALLAQGRSPLDAAKNGVLAHALASTKFQNNWELTPLKLIEKVDKMIGDGANTTVDCQRHG